MNIFFVIYFSSRVSLSLFAPICLVLRIDTKYEAEETYIIPSHHITTASPSPLSLQFPFPSITTSLFLSEVYIFFPSPSSPHHFILFSFHCRRISQR